MDLHHSLLLLGAGLVGGTLSSLVGGAGVITFPALLAVGLPPITAVAANLAALTPGNFFAALYDRGQLPPIDRYFVGLVIVSVCGAAAGAALLLETPTRVFEILIPLLLGFSTVLFAFGSRINAWLRRRSMAKHGRDLHVGRANVTMLLPVSVYGGYFGAGVGVMLLAALAIGSGSDFRATNVTKNLVTSLNSLIATSLFVWRGVVPWTPTLLMMVGAISGALIGARLAQIAPHKLMRVVVVVIGLLLTVTYAWRYWL